MQKLSDNATSFLRSVITYYLGTNIPKLGKDYIDNLLLNKFRTSDVTKLKQEELIKLLNLIFDRAKDLFGDKAAISDLEKSVKGVANVTGITEAYVEFLTVLPFGVMENEKITNLARGDLEEMVRERTSQLEDAKEALELKISERTVELEAERNKLRLVLSNTVDGIFALDKNKKIISFNKAMEEMTGCLESEVLGQDVDDYVKILDKENNMVMCGTYCSTFRHSAAESTVYKADHLFLSGKNNRNYNVRLVSNNVEDVKSNISCIVTVHDVTKQTELETMKFDFVSIAAHELRTPLTAIRGYLSLLMDQLDKNEALSAEQKTFLEKTYMSSNQLYSLVENLLSVSRIERGNVKISGESVEWSSFVTSMVDNFQDFAKSHGITVTYIPSNFKTTVKIDKVMMGEVLSNLLDNAIKYNKPNGSITIFLEESSKAVITHIKDSGLGIPRESIPHLFTKFYRVEGVQEGSHGTGLGLYISKEIVNLHGGEIWVDSSSSGSVFSFTVPKVV